MKGSMHIASSRRSVSKAQRDKRRAKKIKKSAGRGSEGTPVVKLNKGSFRPLIDRPRRLVTWPPACGLQLSADVNQKQTEFPGNMILRSSNCELARLHCFFVFLMSLNSSSPSASELSVHPSTCCRFCQKNVKCRGTAKIPRISLFNEVFNKDLVGFSGADSLVLADLASSLGHDLKSDPRFSDVSCLTYH